MRLYELSVALKYIKPNLRQLSSSIISLISIGVISLVVWLIVVFLSVSWGLEKAWVGKLISLTAPLRVTPTEAYYNSYYHQIDSQSADSSYAPKTIGEKRRTLKTDPYLVDEDPELPADFPKPDLNADGELKDLVKIAFQEIENLEEAHPFEYARAFSTLTLTMLRPQSTPNSPMLISFFKHNVYVGSSENDRENQSSIYVRTTSEDLSNLIFSLKHRVHSDETWVNEPSDVYKNRLNALFEVVRPNKESFDDGFRSIPPFDKSLNPLWSSLSAEDSPLRDALTLGENIPPEPILVPKSFKESGISLGDRGNLTYFVPSAEAPLELKMPVIVAGFYDPGIIPLGGRFILAREEALSLLQNSVPDEMRHEASGIGVRLNDLTKADSVKKELQKRFLAEGIAPYFKIETYKEYDYAKDILVQLQSEKNLFSTLALIILVVACSNIISMLIILVNDKKEEIGILRSMGSSSLSIAAIFGTTGIILGFSGSIIGICLAVLTLLNLNTLVQFVSNIQGYEMFNPLIYGDTLPNELSVEALVFVVLATGLISLIAGFVPACKACLLKPYEILKAE